MIRTNLSTRPFYNERAVHFWMLVVAIAVVGTTIFNVSRVLKYSRSDTQLATQAARNEALASDLRQQAVRLRATVDPRQVEVASAEARQANELIDRRTFSWTELLNKFEKTLPDDVRIGAVRPHIDQKRGIVLTIIVVARSVDDIDQFIRNLEATGEFSETGAKLDEHFNDQGLLENTFETIYRPASSRLPEPVKPAANPPTRGAPRR